MQIVNKFWLAVLFAVGMALNANALLLTPTDADWQGSIPKNPKADDIETITGTSSQLTLLYKNDQGVGEEGSLAGSYDTSYFNTPTDPKDAKIEYTGGSSVSGSPIYLLVKDGNSNPIWYVFDITGWNGTDTIDLQNFWPEQGAISHVSIYGTETRTNVPDAGSSVALLGLALTSVGLLRRKLQAK
jgi:hypothetical protein